MLQYEIIKSMADDDLNIYIIKYYKLLKIPANGIIWSDN